MLARQHANLGVIGMIGAAYGLAAIGNADLAVLPDELNRDLVSLIEPIPLLILTIIGAAYALIPDLDHPGSTVSRKFGFLSQGVSHIFGSLTGGHREASHSLLFSVICGIVGLAIVLLPFQFTVYTGVDLGSEQLFSGIIFVTSVMFIVKLILPMGIGKRYYGFLTLVALGVTFFFAVSDLLPSFGLALAMFLGVNLHILGDSATPSKVKYLWPSNRKFGWNFNGKTGEWRELNVIQPLFITGASALIIITIIVPLYTQLSNDAAVALALFR